MSWPTNRDRTRRRSSLATRTRRVRVTSVYPRFPPGVSILQELQRPVAVPRGARPALALHFGKGVVPLAIAAGKDRPICADLVVARPERRSRGIVHNHLVVVRRVTLKLLL